MLKIAIGAILLTLGAIGLFAGYSNGHVIASIFSWAAMLIGAALVTFGIADYRRSQKMQHKKPYSELEKRLLIQSMAYVAKADGEMHAMELTTISNIHEQLLKTPITQQEIEQRLKSANGEETLSNLEANKGNISEQMKHIIIQSCHLIMISDSEIAKQEEHRIHALGAALGLSANEVDEHIAKVSA